MKIYRHYKKKLYKVHHMAKHSEDLSDLVFYECLYPNESGAYWVRPKALFFGDLDIDGTTHPRFEEMKIKIHPFTSITPEIIDRLEAKIPTLLRPLEKGKILRRLQENPSSPLLLEAEWDGQWAGFKLGYTIDSSTFYSWLGGVCKEFRGFGIGTELMRNQHQWCIEQGFRRIETKTENRYKNMLKLNLEHGFEIVGVENKASLSEIDEDQSHNTSSTTSMPLKIVLVKNLDKQPL